jgi:hypothetical protein
MLPMSDSLPTTTRCHPPRIKRAKTRGDREEDPDGRKYGKKQKNQDLRAVIWVKI